MIGIVVAAFVVASSICLLSYWFRYACLLIIARHPTNFEMVQENRFSPFSIRRMLRRRSVVNIDRVCELAVANQLSFPEIQALLRDSSDVDLEHLRESLDRDYAAVIHLLNRGRDRLAAARYELFILASNYRLLKALYFVQRRCLAQDARDTLEEMSWVVGHFADCLAAP